MWRDNLGKLEESIQFLNQRVFLILINWFSFLHGELICWHSECRHCLILLVLHSRVGSAVGVGGCSPDSQALAPLLSCVTRKSAAVCRLTYTQILQKLNWRQSSSDRPGSHPDFEWYESILSSVLFLFQMMSARGTIDSLSIDKQWWKQHDWLYCWQTSWKDSLNWMNSSNSQIYK